MPTAQRTRPIILLVDDDEATREGLHTWLAGQYDVICAADGLEALEAVARMQHPPDLVLADVWMPRLDGVAMLRRMRQDCALRRVPVIFLTGQTSARSMVDGITAGARAYLTKPIDPDVLDRKVRQALRDPRDASPSSPPAGVGSPLTLTLVRPSIQRSTMRRM